MTVFPITLSYPFFGRHVNFVIGNIFERWIFVTVHTFIGFVAKWLFPQSVRGMSCLLHIMVLLESQRDSQEDLKQRFPIMVLLESQRDSQEDLISMHHIDASPIS